MKVRGIDVEEKFVEEEIAPQDRKPWITWMQPTFIWTGTEFALIGLRHGDVASRNISVDCRKLIEEKIPLIKRKYDSKKEIVKEDKKK